MDEFTLGGADDASSNEEQPARKRIDCDVRKGRLLSQVLLERSKRRGAPFTFIVRDEVEGRDVISVTRYD